MCVSIWINHLIDSPYGQATCVKGRGGGRVAIGTVGPPLRATIA